MRLAEELTLTTYYPAPYGVYRQMRTTESLLLQAEPMFSDGPQIEWRTSEAGGERHWNIDQWQDPISTRLRFFTEDNANITPLEERVTILENGNVGIGTKNPGDKLQVLGHTRVGVNGTDYLQIGHGGANSYINAVGVGRLDFRHEGSNQMVLTDTGRLGIGTVTPDGKLGVDGEINFVPQDIAPAGNKGDLYYDNTVDNEFKYHDGSDWQTLGGGGGCFIYYCNTFAPKLCINSGGEQGYCPAGFKEKYALGSWGSCLWREGVGAPYQPFFCPPGGNCNSIRGQAYFCCQ